MKPVLTKDLLVDLAGWDLVKEGRSVAEAVPREAALQFLRGLMHDHSRRKPAEIA